MVTWFNFGRVPHKASPLALTSLPHIPINISETSLSSLFPTSLLPLIAHASQHLRRVYPRGTRIQSSNFAPEVYWRSGTQVASLNWQRYDAGMQVNEAMFVGKAFSAYILATLLHSSGFAQLQWCSTSVQTISSYHRIKGALRGSTNPMIVRSCSWGPGAYEDEPGKDDLIVVFCARLDRVVGGSGWL
jgi:phosphatidylinositol phospholipase C delta